MDSYLKKRTATKNKLHGEGGAGNSIQVCLQVFKAQSQTFGQRGKRNRGSSAGACETGSAAATDLVDQHTWDRDKDRIVLGRGNGWLLQVREGFTALQLCWHNPNHTGIG